MVSHQTNPNPIIDTESPAKVGFEAIPRSKVYQEVAKQLERRITEEMKPGDLLPPERQLVQMLGVSRSSVRDAIRSLELKGLLEPRQGVGTVVCSPGATPANNLATALLEKRKMVADLLDVRQMLEPPFLKVVDVLMDLLRETRERSLQVEGRQEKSLAGHRRILAALKREDAAAAEAAMRRHLQEMETIVLQKL